MRPPNELCWLAWFDYLGMQPICKLVIMPPPPLPSSFLAKANKTGWNVGFLPLALPAPWDVSEFTAPIRKCMSVCDTEHGRGRPRNAELSLSCSIFRPLLSSVNKYTGGIGDEYHSQKSCVRTPG